MTSHSAALAFRAHTSEGRAGERGKGRKAERQEGSKAARQKGGGRNCDRRPGRAWRRLRTSVTHLFVGRRKSGGTPRASARGDEQLGRGAEGAHAPLCARRHQAGARHAVRRGDRVDETSARAGGDRRVGELPERLSRPVARRVHSADRSRAGRSGRIRGLARPVSASRRQRFIRTPATAPGEPCFFLSANRTARARTKRRPGLS